MSVNVIAVCACLVTFLCIVPNQKWSKSKFDCWQKEKKTNLLTHSFKFHLKFYFKLMPSRQRSNLDSLLILLCATRFSLSVLVNLFCAWESREYCSIIIFPSLKYSLHHRVKFNLYLCVTKYIKIHWCGAK